MGQRQIDDITACEFVWFSHGHPDHLDPASIERFRASKILLPAHVGSRIYNNLKAQGYNVTIVENDKWTKLSPKISILCLSEDYHVYAVKWTAEEVAWYFDGRRVAATPTPADMHKPMYLLVNLAVGGWAESPDASTVFPAEFRIERIRVFQPPRVGAVTSGR